MAFTLMDVGRCNCGCGYPCTWPSTISVAFLETTSGITGSGSLTPTGLGAWDGIMTFSAAPTKAMFLGCSSTYSWFTCGSSFGYSADYGYCHNITGAPCASLFALGFQRPLILSTYSCSPLSVVLAALYGGAEIFTFTP